MASKGSPFVDQSTGVACTAYSNFKVKIGAGAQGIRLPKAKQFLIPMLTGEDREAAVQRHEVKIRCLLRDLQLPST